MKPKNGYPSRLKNLLLHISDFSSHICAIVEIFMELDEQYAKNRGNYDFIITPYEFLLYLIKAIRRRTRR